MAHRHQQEQRGNRSSLLKRLLAGISVTAVFFILLAIVLLLVVLFGSCQNAATIADLAPEKLSIGSASYTHDRIASAIMKLRKADCKINVSAIVFRFCNDHSIREGAIISEEAMLAEIKMQNVNGPIDKLTLHFTPGVISGTPGGIGQYQEVMEDEIGSLKRGEPTSSTNTARWQIDFVSGGPIYPPSEGGPIVIPVHFYGLEARSASPSLTCQATSRATVISYELKRGAIIEGDNVPVETVVRSWNEITKETDSKQYFVRRRADGKNGIKAIQQKEIADHVHTVWSDVPPTYPDENIDYPTARFQFCDDGHAKCR